LYYCGKELALLGRGASLFSKVTLFSLPEVFCGPQLCQKIWGAQALRATTKKVVTFFEEKKCTPMLRRSSSVPPYVKS